MERLRRARLIKSLESLERLQHELVDEARQEMARAQSSAEHIERQLVALNAEYKRQTSALLTMTLDEKMTFSGYVEHYTLEKSKLQKQHDEHLAEVESARDALKDKYREQKVVQKALDRRHNEQQVDENLDEMRTLDELAAQVYQRASRK